MPNIEEFKQFMKTKNAEHGFGLTEHECECYAYMHSVLDEIAGHRLSMQQLFDTYDFFTDTLEGKHPQIMLIDIKDAYKGFYRLSKLYPATGDLSEEERRLFCFAIYWAYCIKTYDEETDRVIWSLGDFKKGKDFIVKMYKYEREHSPQKFTVRSLSDPTRDDYGYSRQNPIEVLSVALEYQYLNAIETSDGKEITRGKKVVSYKGEGGTLIDGFEIYVQGFLKKKKIATLYLCAYGAENSRTAPKGFRFKRFS